MKIKLPIIMFIIILLSLSVFTDKITIGQTSLVNGVTHKKGSGDIDHVELNKISGNVWMHTTYSNDKGTRIPSNGIVYVTDEGIILVDTPWNNEQTESLIRLIREVFEKDIRLAVITHAHEDRIGGISTLLDHGVDVRCTERTEMEAIRRGYLAPQPLLDSETVIRLGGLEAEVFFPGEGHTSDNITVWFPEDKVLFGGCLIKSMDTDNKGNVADANLEAWPESVLNVMDRYADAVIVVPGHGQWGSSDLLGKTWELVSQ